MEAFDEMLCTNKIRRYTKDYYNRRISAKLVNFISSKNKLKFRSDFDRKGAKKFLDEKAKAMEEIVLDDTTDEENKNILNENNYKRNKSHNKFVIGNRHVKPHHSHNSLLMNFQINKFSNKKNNTLKDDNKYMSSNTVLLINSIKDIGKIMNKKNKRKFLGSIKKRYSNANGKESSYLMTGENDSFIGSIVNQIKEFKN